MALLYWEVFEYWLNNNGLFYMRGVKVGLGEIDFLAVRPDNNKLECWQVEVTVSFRPIGYIEGGPIANKSDASEVEQGAEEYINKKFTSENKSPKETKLFQMSIGNTFLYALR